MRLLMRWKRHMVMMPQRMALYGVASAWQLHTLGHHHHMSLSSHQKSPFVCDLSIQEPDDSSDFYRIHFCTRLHFSTCKRRIKMTVELQITTSPIKICIMTCVKFQSLNLYRSGWGQIFIERPSYYMYHIEKHQKLNFKKNHHFLWYATFKAIYLKTSFADMFRVL